MENQIIPFENKGIRKAWHNEQWYFSIVDIIEVLTETNNPNRYWTDLKRKIQKESQSYDFIVSLKLSGKDGRKRLTDCANTQGILRIIMSVPSPKAEPLKQWLAEQGKRTIDELNDPELLTERQAEYYKLKGYSDKWIKERLQSIKTRNELTDEWKQRGITEQGDYSYLTATIAQHTFGLKPSEHKDLKGIEPGDNLRDNMTTIELLFSALGEEATRQIAIRDNAQGYHENYEAAVKGGQGASDAINNFEKSTSLKVVSTKNFKSLKEGKSDKQIDTTD